jgi:flagella basal body P-ring formation protein FlgA
MQALTSRHRASAELALALAAATFATSACAHTILEAAQQQLHRELDAPSRRVEIRPLLDAAALAAVEGPTSAVARPTGAIHPSSRMTVRVDLIEAGRVARQVDVPFEVHAYERVPVAARDIGAGESFGDADCERREVDLAALKSEIVSGDDAARRWVARRAIAAGSPLRRDQVDARRDVMLGERVQLHHTVGALRFDAIAVAEQGGSAGQLIRVRPDSATGAVYARITGAGSVQLEEQTR